MAEFYLKNNYDERAQRIITNIQKKNLLIKKEKILFFSFSPFKEPFSI